MIANPGADAKALEHWRTRRRRVFYPKTDLDFDLAARLQRKRELGKSDLSKLASILDEGVISVEFDPNAGTFHAVFKVQTNRGRYFLKLATEAPAFEYAIEAWAMQRLRQTPVAAYRIDARDMPAPYLIVHEARGKRLTDFENLDNQALPEPLLYELGRLMARIHSHPGEGAGFLDPESLYTTDTPRGLHRKWIDYFLLRLDAQLEICEQIGAIPKERAAIEAQFANAAALLEEAPLRWLHGDPGHHNFFSDGQSITSVIDWEDSVVGDPIFDVAFWGTFCRDEMRAEFLRGYQTIHPLPEDFERRFWLYYLRIAISKTAHRHFFGAKDRPGRPPASQRIQKALSKLEEM